MVGHILQLSVLGTSVVVLPSLDNSFARIVAIAAIALAFLTPFFLSEEVLLCRYDPR